MGGKVIGIITWKARAGEKLNFAAPSKLVAPLLASSGVQPLVSVPKPAAPSTGKKRERLDVHHEWTRLPSAR
jgi:S1-C subfamily serine protease